jgi:RimJ/RimL family protein N-acetyltransferase
VTREAAAGWLAARVAAWPRELNLAICVARSRRHVGNIYLRDIDPAAGRAELHVFIAARRDRGRGIGSAAIAALCRRAFAELGLREVFVRVLEDNAAAMHVYEKCGFRRCGATPPSVRKGGCELAVCRLALSAP